MSHELVIVLSNAFAAVPSEAVFVIVIPVVSDVCLTPLIINSATVAYPVLSCVLLIINLK